MCNRSTFDLYGESDAGIDLRGNVPCITADRRKFDLSACRWKFCGAAVYLGACCSQYWSELDGHCRNVDFYSDCFGGLYIVSWNCTSEIERKRDRSLNWDVVKFNFTTSPIEYCGVPKRK